MGPYYDCPFYPCHISLDHCIFCYCPLYKIECGHNYHILENGVKDCSKCIYPHKHENFDELFQISLKDKDSNSALHTS